ncbi:MAG: flavodoxin [Muribaculaceae bacterium]
MIRRSLILATVTMMSILSASARTLVVYYSFTNNVHTIVSDLSTQIDADVVRIEPTEKGIDYAANNYAAGSALISAIRNNPNDPASYPAIDPVEINMAAYDVVIVAAPLWWSNMAAPLQTFLFQHSGEMAGKHIALIVSSASSGISNVVADAKRLIPQGVFLEPNLWIRSSQVANCHSMIAQWLSDINYAGIASVDTAVSGGEVPVAAYNAYGQKISSPCSAAGFSIVQYKKGNSTYSKKIYR